MAHFAKINDDNMVVEVIVIGNAQVDNLPFPESEPLGQQFIADCGIEGQWLQTSYNNNFRNVFAGLNMFFDANLGEYGEFIPPKIDPDNDKQEN